MPTSNGTVDLKAILPRGGDQEGAFEELSFLLFAREYRTQGVPMRRQGAGGDGGLEGTIADAEGKALVGLQAKFFDDKFDSTQWRGLDQSIHTALEDNVGDFGLREIVVTLPRTLTQRQAEKWTSRCANWTAESKRMGYAHDITRTPHRDRSRRKAAHISS